MNRNIGCIKSFFASLVYNIIFLVICGYGLLLHFSTDSTGHNVRMLSYFTILSNLFCFIMTLLFIYIETKNKLSSKSAHSPYIYMKNFSHKYYFFRGMSLMGILLTFFIYHFMVAKYKYPLLTNNILCLPTKDLLAHYVIPFMYVIDWLMFLPKNVNSIKSPLYWQIYPFIYLVTIMSRFFIFPKESILHLDQYPYFFLDVEELGFPVFIIIMILILLVIIAIGYLIIGIERIIIFIYNRYHIISKK